MGSSGARWLLLIGFVLAAAGVAALIGAGDEEVVNWLKDNATCNDRPCTYDEAKGILTGIGVVGIVAGLATTGFGLWRLSRSGERRPPSAATAERSVEPLDRLADLDAMLARGELEVNAYMRRRADILREL